MENTEKKWPPDRRLIWGIGALASWIFLFSFGILVPSGTHRDTLGWTSEPDTKEEVERIQAAVTAKEEETKTKINELESTIEHLHTPKVAPLINTDERISKAKEELKADLTGRIDNISRELEALGGSPKPKPSKSLAFLIAMFSFTPPERSVSVHSLCLSWGLLGK
jgi:hypothetical protein